MPCFKPATPGFLVTLVATGLLAAVVFSVPYIKSIYFLKATLHDGNTDEIFTFGVLGYCLQLPNGTTCSKPAVGYQLNVNQLLGDDINELQIPNVLVKWITDALVLHIVALVLAALAAVMGLLAHVREMSMVYCSTCFSGFAAAVTLVAFIFDLVLFFVTKSRINGENGGKAEFGIGVWLTLAAWIILFLAGCFYGLGRCCVRRRPRGDWERKEPSAAGSTHDQYAEQMRLDAIKAENDRKARQKQGEVGLPAFNEYEAMPLKTADEQYMEDGDHIVPYHPDGPGALSYGRQPTQTNQYAAGYAQAPVGTRAVDAYYNDAQTAPSRNPSYPPQRQASGYAQSTYSQGGHAAQPTNASAVANQYYGAPYPAAATDNYGQAVGTPTANQYYSPANQYSHEQYASAPEAYGGHVGGGASYASHQQYPSADPYVQSRSPISHAAPGPSQASQTGGYAQQLDRSYTLGGSTYSPNNLTVLPEVPHTAGLSGESEYYSIPSPHHTTPSPTTTYPSHTLSVPQTQQTGTSSTRGLRVQNVDETPSMPHPDYEDSPPMYDAATSQPAGVWAEKH